MKHTKFKPDLTGWGLQEIDRFGEMAADALRKLVAEVLHMAFEDDETYIYFPVDWSKDPEETCPGSDGIGGPEVKDPLTVYLCVGLEGENGEKPTYEFNLRDVIFETINVCAEDGSFAPGLRRLSASLRALADNIDAVLPK